MLIGCVFNTKARSPHKAAIDRISPPTSPPCLHVLWIWAGYTYRIFHHHAVPSTSAFNRPSALYSASVGQRRRPPLVPLLFDPKDLQDRIGQWQARRAGRTTTWVPGPDPNRTASLSRPPCEAPVLGSPFPSTPRPVPNHRRQATLRRGTAHSCSPSREMRQRLRVEAPQVPSASR